MRKIKFLSAILATLIGLSVGVFAQDKPQDLKQSQGTQTTCPIMGGPVDKDIYVDYQGKRIYVCCYECYDTVKADPAKYVKQMESQGIILEKVLDSTQEQQPNSTTSNAQDGHSDHQH